MHWVPAGPALAFEAERINPLKLEYDGQHLALIVIRDASDALHVFTDQCPHRGAPFSDVGLLDEGRLICGWHYWSFQLEDGVNPHMPESCVKKWPHKIDNGTLLIYLDG